jgi:hypothetical protein
MYKPRWFVISQTVGEECMPPRLPEWDADRALAALDIERIAFTNTNGNCQGYAKKRQIAINPVAQVPHKTLFHEAAQLCCLRSYVVLGGQDVWNEALPGSGLYITISSIPPVASLLFAGCQV